MDIREEDEVSTFRMVFAVLLSFRHPPVSFSFFFPFSFLSFFPPSYDTRGYPRDLPFTTTAVLPGCQTRIRSDLG
jgi:hypothetical protein